MTLNSHLGQCARSPGDRAVQVEAGSELATGQRVQVTRPGAPAQQVHSAPPELAGARARQQEAGPPPLAEAVDFVEDLRKPLDLVDHDHAIAGRELLSELPRPLAQGEVHGAVEQVVDTGLRQTESSRPAHRTDGSLARHFTALGMTSPRPSS